MDGLYHPRGCFRGADGKYHYAGSVIGADGHYKLDDASLAGNIDDGGEPGDRQRRNREGVNC